MRRRPTTRAARPRALHPARGAVVGLLAMATLTGLSACSGGDDDGDAAAPASPPTAPAPATTAARTTVVWLPTTTTAPTTTLAATTTTAAPAVPDLGVPALTAAAVTGPDGVEPELTAEGRDTVTKLVADYVARAVATPIGTGAAADLTGVLSSVLAPTLTAEQRATLTDEGVPRLTLVTTDRFAVAADALATSDGQIGVVNCIIDLQVSGVTVDTGEVVTIARRGDLTYVWEPAAGAWQLDSFELTVDRTLP